MDLESLWRDLRYAMRMLRRNPAFATIAILTLTLGIGATSAVFSIAYGVLLRPLPYPEPERLVALEQTFAGVVRNSATTVRKYLFWRENQHTLESVATFRGVAAMNLESRDEPARVLSRAVTADFFRALRVVPRTGRFFLSGEDEPGASPVAVLSYGLWQRRFGADPARLGQNIVVGAQSYTLIGVAPAGMDSTLAADVWIPLQLAGNPFAAGSNFNVIARLKNGVSLSEAQADLRLIAEQYRAAYPRDMRPTETAGVFPYQQEAVREARPMLLILLAVVNLVLLIACANVANLLLARASARRREIAIRVAIGADRARVMRQLLTESVCLSLAGGALGLGLAKLAVWAFVELKPVRLARLEEITIDLPVTLFTLGVALGTGILFGLAPVLQTLRADVQEVLPESGTRSGDGRRGRQLRGGLVVLEFALSMILVISATLLVQTVVRLRMVEPGFDPNRLLTLRVTLTSSRYQTASQVASFSQQALARIAALPGVVSAATTNYLPLGGGFNIPLASIEGRPNPERRFLGNLEWFGISPQFFRAMGMKLHGGRNFTEGDNPASPAVVIVNETFAKRYFPSETALGQRITIAWNLLGSKYADSPRSIVGVAADIREGRLQAPARPSVFVPLAQVGDAVSETVNRTMPTTLLVRTAGDPTSLSRDVLAEMRSLDPLLPVFQIRAMAQVMEDAIQSQRFLMILLAVFAVLALMLAAIGIYGVMSYAVAQRTREIGIRAALGASPARLLRMVIGEGLGLAGLGLILGAAGAGAGTRLLETFLFGVTSRDPQTFVATPLILAGVALLACYIPARKALRIEPIAALRHE